MTLELYHNNMSVCAQRVRLVLREKGLAPAEHHLNLRGGDQFRPDYLVLNPNGVVPTLVVDGRPVTESTVICEYLDDAYPDPPLRPADPVDRAVMRQWTMMPDTGVHAATGTISSAVAFRHQYLALSPEAREANIRETPDPARQERKRQTIELGVEAPFVPGALKTFDRMLARIEAALAEGDWLVGGAYSLADVAMTPYVVRLDHLRCTGFFERNPRVADWLRRIMARPNFGGIADYLDDSYIELMDRTGREAWPRLAGRLGAA